MTDAMEAPPHLVELAFAGALPERALSVFTVAGLCNRLRLLASGMALAQATGRDFAMLWPRAPDCGAAFAELFAGTWPVVDLPTMPPELRAFEVISRSLEDLRRLRTDSRQRILLGYHSWLLPPENGRVPSAVWRHCLDLVNALRPIAPILEAVESFRTTHFRPRMIGVHLRRGDYVRFRPDDVWNVAPALTAVDDFLGRYPDAGILLATDDGALDPWTGRVTAPEGLHTVFRQRYGTRAVWHPVRSLDRRSVETIQDAVVDLWLLRCTDAFVGSFGSSYSDHVLVGRTTPHVLCAAETPADARIARLLRAAGLAPLVRLAMRRRFGRDLAFPIACRYAVRVPLERAKRLRAFR